MYWGYYKYEYSASNKGICASIYSFSSFIHTIHLSLSHSLPHSLFYSLALSLSFIFCYLIVYRIYDTRVQFHIGILRNVASTPQFVHSNVYAYISRIIDLVTPHNNNNNVYFPTNVPIYNTTTMSGLLAGSTLPHFKEWKYQR